MQTCGYRLKSTAEINQRLWKHDSAVNNQHTSVWFIDFGLCTNLPHFFMLERENRN